MTDYYNLKRFFDNGYGVSVVRNKYSYGGDKGLYELAVLKGGKDDYELCYDSGITVDVLGWLNEDEVNENIQKVRELRAEVEQVSDYTPTTEEVRTAYISYTQPSLSESGQLFYGDKTEFDRWLESIMHKAHIAERDRIIKLLKAEFGAWSEAVALIEGEMK